MPLEAVAEVSAPRVNALPDRAHSLILGTMSTNSLERAIAGALRAAIKDHGPITAAGIGSAVKRIVGNLSNADLGALAPAAMARRRWGGTTEEERRIQLAPEFHASGGRAAWSKLTPEERSAEMKLRAAKRTHSGRKPRGPAA